MNFGFTTSLNGFVLSSEDFLEQPFEFLVVESSLHEVFESMALDIVHGLIDILSPLITKFNQSFVCCLLLFKFLGSQFYRLKRLIIQGLMSRLTS
jgi:hypothetical protein